MNTRIFRAAHFSYAENAKSAVVSPASGSQLKMFYCKTVNRTGGAIDMGILRKFSTSEWSLLTVDAALASTDATSTVQGGTAVSLFSATVDAVGYAVQCPEPFGLIGLTISQAIVAGTLTYKYWNGTSFATLTTIAVPTYALGTSLVVFAAPSDWVAGKGTLTGDASNSKYTILIQASTHPTTVAKTTAVWVGQFLDFAPSVAANGVLEFSVPQETPLIFNGQEGLLPYFGGAANAANLVAVRYVVD